MADVLVVAGEPSGDLHASVLVRELKTRHPDLSVCAVGGSNLQKSGAHLLFDMMPFSVVGLAETLKHYGTFVRLLKWLVRWVRVYQPKVVCLVDFPGFNLRLAQALYRAGLSKKAGGSTSVYGYIAPQIWAWKARRRFKIARWFDALGVIFPFEIACFADTTLKVNFVGHPLLQQPNPFRYDPNGPLLSAVAVAREPPRCRNAYFPTVERSFRVFEEKSSVSSRHCAFPERQCWFLY